MDLRSATKLLPDNTEGFYKISSLQYRLGHLSDSLKWVQTPKNVVYIEVMTKWKRIVFLSSREIRECLKLDPEHKLCFPHYKKVKKIEKLMSDAEENINSKDYKTAIDKAKKVSKNTIFCN